MTDVETKIEKPKNLKRKIKLASFFTAISLVLGGIGGSGQHPLEAPPPEILSVATQDILTENDLKNANIEIHQTNNVKLSLRKSALEFPVFQDAIKKKNGGVEIILVDGLGSFENLSQADQRLYQGTHHDNEGLIYNLQVMGEEINLNEWYVWSLKNDGSLNPLRERSRLIFKNHPEMENKIIIFLAVGGNFTPKFKDSFPFPGIFYNSRSSVQNEKGYVFNPANTTTGFSLRHEISHATRPIFPQGADDEARADMLAMSGLVDAWTRYILSGGKDIGGYPFVFMTKDAVVIN